MHCFDIKSVPLSRRYNTITTTNNNSSSSIIAYIQCRPNRSVLTFRHGGRDRGGQGGHGPSNNLVGGAILYLPPPQYFALEFKILTLD